MELKPEILVCIDWFLPGYKAGGPIKSVFNIVSSLKHIYRFSIVCGDTDFGDTVPYSGIPTNTWIEQDGYRIMYLSRKYQTITRFQKLLQEKSYDTIYLNSLFSVKFTFYPLLAFRAINYSNAKVILAPRGMLGKGALALKKYKKNIFIAVAKALGLFKSVTWHASTELEAAEIRNVFGEKATIKIATNISALALAATSIKIKTPHHTVFCFLSRISPKKNLLGALRLLSRAELVNEVVFRIIGPVEDNTYWEACQKQIAVLPTNIKIQYIGAVPNTKLPTLLKGCHFLFLPTFSENFGHVVIESWEAGCPVIISDQTPWRNLQKDGVGWDIPLDNEQRFIEVLQQCNLMEQEAYNRLSMLTQEYLKKHVMTDAILEQNIALFSES